MTLGLNGQLNCSKSLFEEAMKSNLSFLDEGPRKK
jgi:hypothetical protein